MANKYEELFKEQMPEYYEEIKDIVPHMPDIRTFQTEFIRKKIKKWDDDSKWKSLIDDFDTLFAASKRGKEGKKDARFIIFMQKLNKNSKELKKFYQKTDVTDYTRFVITYPAISWLFAMVNPLFRPVAIQGGYAAWIDDVDNIDSIEHLSSKKRLEYALLAYANYETVNRLLSPLLNNEKYTKNLAELWDEASTYRTVDLVNWLLDNGIPLGYGVIAFPAKVSEIEKYENIFGKLDHLLSFGDTEITRKLLTYFIIDDWNAEWIQTSIGAAFMDNRNILSIYQKNGFKIEKATVNMLDIIIDNHEVDPFKDLFIAGLTIDNDDALHLMHHLLGKGYKETNEMLDYVMSLGFSPFGIPSGFKNPLFINEMHMYDPSLSFIKSTLKYFGNDIDLNMIEEAIRSLAEKIEPKSHAAESIKILAELYVEKQKKLKKNKAKKQKKFKE